MAHADKIRAVIYQDGNVWVGQCVDYDIGVQAPDVETLHQRMELAIRLEREMSTEIHGEAFAGIDRAPPHFEELYQRSKMNVSPSGGKDTLDLALCA